MLNFNPTSGNSFYSNTGAPEPLKATSPPKQDLSKIADDAIINDFKETEINPILTALTVVNWFTTNGGQVIHPPVGHPTNAKDVLKDFKPE